MSRAKRPPPAPLPGGIEPRSNPDLVGHDGPRALLAEAVAAGRLHHAWLFAGPEGIGKATLAYRFLRWLMAGCPGGPAMEVAAGDPVFRRIATGAHADLRVLEPSTGERGVKRMIRVDEARAVPRFLSLTAAEGGWRAVLVDGAEALGPEAQNALLKTLEEPPARALLLLVTHAPDRLLPTIRSRVRRLDCFPLPADGVARVLRRVLPEASAEALDGLVALAEGAPGRAVRLAEGEGLGLHQALREVLEQLPALPVPAQHALADRLAGVRDGSAFVTFMELLQREVAAATAAAARGAARPAWMGSASLADWAALWDRLGRIAAETETYNLDRKQAVLNGLAMLADPGRAEA